MGHDIYSSPLCGRYASKTMQHIFSDDFKFGTWRKLWIALAESEKELGIEITDEQIQALKDNKDFIDYEKAAEYEKQYRHDVMAHIHTYGDMCGDANGIIHLGATSCYVGDNTDVIQMKEGLLQVRKLLIKTIETLRDYAEKYMDLPTLAYTHFQAAQPTTFGKRATLWMNDLVSDLEKLDFELDRLALLGCKGTTGTGASFLALFNGDHDKVKLVEKKIAEKVGFKNVCAVSGQTYSRKMDFNVLSVLSAIAQSCAKFSNDFRLLSHLKEVDEPFESGQVGSSAMAYKRNPMRSERIGSLSRYIMIDLLNPAMTAAGQWLERTLDDSANRRISIPEAFLATDAILSLYINIISGCRVYPMIVKKHLDEEIPFMATENILMYCVKKGGDRQDLHEAIRLHSLKSLEEVKLKGKANDLIERIMADSTFGLTEEEMNDILDVNKFTGRAKEQTREFIDEIINPLLAKNSNNEEVTIEINV